MIKFSDLTPEQVQEICEAFAIREGWRFETNPMSGIRFGVHDDQAVYDLGVSDYPNDKNAMGRIIEGMSVDEVMEYDNCLYQSLDRGLNWHKASALLHQASCAHQFVAAALALGILNKEEK